MVTGPGRIDTLEAGLARLAAAEGGTVEPLVVILDQAVPAWLASLVDAAAARGAAVVVQAAAPHGLAGEALAGWEIGVCTAALAAGVSDVVGVDARRVARVREVDAALAAHAPQRAPEVAS